jgi:hypothetical protein
MLCIRCCAPRRSHVAYLRAESRNCWPASQSQGTFMTPAMMESPAPTTRICTEALATDLKPDKEAKCYTRVPCDRNITAYGHGGITLRPCSPANLVPVPERHLRIAPRAPTINVCVTRAALIIVTDVAHRRSRHRQGRHKWHLAPVPRCVDLGDSKAPTRT